MTSSSFKTLKTAWVGDIHLGHHETRTNHILTNLYRAFEDNPSMSDLDIMFIEGDVFDRLLSFPDDAVREIKLWMFHLLNVCKKHDVAIRVLEGTPSHDWRQSKWFVSLNEDMGGVGADLKYIDKLCIVHEDKWGIDVLYVPDEWRPTPEQTQQEVQALLNAKGLKQVDIACMHGYFAPQLPSKLAHGAHDLDFYLNCVRYVIGIGHVHQFWRHKHIVASGSFDRISHGEQEPKGHTVITIHVDKPGKPDVEFIENQGAKKYMTVDCRGKDFEAAKADVERLAKALPKGSAVRIVCQSADTIAASLAYFKDLYPNHTWKLTRKDKGSSIDSDEQMVELVDVQRRATIATITPENIVDLVRARLERTAPEHAESAAQRLTRFIQKEAV